SDVASSEQSQRVTVSAAAAAPRKMTATGLSGCVFTSPVSSITGSHGLFIEPNQLARALTLLKRSIARVVERVIDPSLRRVVAPVGELFQRNIGEYVHQVLECEVGRKAPGRSLYGAQTHSSAPGFQILLR